jgi:agmatine deiminase
MKTLLSRPSEDGFRMPGEFEPHRGTYMIWPERPDNWRNGGKPAQKVFAEVAAAIGRREKLTMLVSRRQYANALSMLPDYVRVVEMSSDDSWARDSGCTFVKNDTGGLRGIDWDFNAWGGMDCGLYFPWDRDAEIAGKMCALEDADRYRTEGFVLEGGAIHTDGQGTVITTEACLLSAGRNPGMTKREIEDTLKSYLRADKVIWLRHGIFMDETSEHVDNICCFVRPSLVALAWAEDKNDPQYAYSCAAFDVLSSERDAKGRKLEVVKVRQPSKPLVMTAEESAGIDSAGGAKKRGVGDRLAASYINYYVCNGAVIAPAFGVPEDGEAKAALERLYPDREVIQIYSREILLGGGNIHCVTQQVPLP